MSNYIEKAISEIPYDARIAQALRILSKGFAWKVSTASAKTTLTMDDYIHINSGNVDVVVPTASADNIGKMFIIQFTNATCDATNIIDDSKTPNSIVAAAQIAQYNVFILVSAGATTLGTSGYYVIGLTGAAIA